MEKMPTSAKNNTSPVAGFTLLEALLTLSILSLGALISASVINARSPRLHVSQAADQLVADLKRARLYADTRAVVVNMRAENGGYAIERLDIHRRFRKGLVVSWEGDIAFAGGNVQPGAAVSIRERNASAVVRIYPVTGRIERNE